VSILFHTTEGEFALVSVLTGPAFECSPEDDFQIHPERPMLYVVQIELHTMGHFFIGIRLASVTVNLRPTGNARFDPMPLHVHGQFVFVQVIVR
jgi:hypothetical protein